MTLSAWIPQSRLNDIADKKQVRDTNALIGANFDKGTVDRLGSISHNYHWLAPGSALAFAQSGYDANSPEVHQAAQLDLGRQLRDMQFDSLMRRAHQGKDLGNLSSATYNALTNQQKAQIKKVADASNDSGGGGILGAITGGISDLTYSAGRLAAGDLPGAIAGAGSETATQSDLPASGTVAKGIRRGVNEAGTIANSGLQLPLAGIRSAASAAEQAAQGNPDFSFFAGDPGGKQKEAAATDVGQQVIAATQGKDPFATGDGILPDPNSPILKAQAQAARNQGALIDGHGFTIGRGIGAALNEAFPHTIFQPGQPGFTAVSGITDAITAGKLDPTAQVLKGYSDARAANKFFAPERAEAQIPYSGTDVLDAALRNSGKEFTASRYGMKAQELDKLFQNDPGGYFDTIGQLHGPDIKDAVVADVAARQHSQAAFDLAQKTGLSVSDPPYTNRQTASQWTVSNQATPTMENLAGEKSPYKIWLMTGKKFDLETAKAFADASTPQEAQQVVLDHLNSPGMQGPFHMPAPGGYGYSWKMGVANHALTGMLPDVQVMQPHNGEETLSVLNAVRQESHLSVQQVAPIMDRFIASTTLNGREAAIKAMGDLIQERMVASGTPLDKAQELTHFMNASARDAFNNADSLISDQQALPFNPVVGGEGLPIADPTITAQGSHTGIEIPRATELRNATSNAAKLLQSPVYRTTSAGLEGFMQNVWKPLHLLRPELGLRIILDSQANLAANGFDSLFTHPINYISMMVGQADDGILMRALSKGVDPSYLTDGLGEPLIDASNMALQHAMYGGMNNIAPSELALKDQVRVPISDPNAPKGVVTGLQRLRNDQVVRGLLNQPSGLDAKEWFYNGGGKALREALVDPTQKLNNISIANETLGDNLAIHLEDRPGSDAFVQSILDQVSSKTGNHPDFIDALRTGKINGVPMWRNNLINKHAVNQADSIIQDELTNPSLAGREGMAGKLGNEGIVGYTPRHAAAYAQYNGIEMTPLDTPPQPRLPVDTMVDAPVSRSASAVKRYWQDNVVRTLFNHILTNPDVKIDRIPAYAQSLWGTANKVGTIERIAPYLSVDDYNTLMENAGNANLPKEVIDRLSAIGGHIDTTAPRVPLPVAMGQAQNEAMDNIVNLVHDLHSRSQFGDMTRVLFPFGDAFRRVAARWATTAWNNPQSLRRLQQGMQGAMQSGFFNKDPQSGDLMFTYPGSSWLTDKLLGIPIPLQGRVKGLSMIGTGLPGVGPAASLPAQWFLPDTPQFDGIRKIIFPAGEAPTTGNPLTDIAQSAEPTYLTNLARGAASVSSHIVGPQWFNAMVTNPPDQKSYNDTVGAMMNYLASSGNYDLHGDNATKEASRLMADAKSKAGLFYLIRGFAQATSPTSPSPGYQIKDKSGHLQILNVVKNDYRNHYSSLGPDGAMKWLFDKYGPNNFFIAQSSSAPIGYAVPVTKKGQDWARSNPDMRSKYPSTYGFFAPSSKGDKFDITAYEDQFRDHERVTLSPEDQSKLANSRVGLWQYHKLRDKIIQANGGDPLSSDQSAILNVFNNHLKDTYPGYKLVTYDSSRLPTAIDELTKASKDPQVASSDAGQGLIQYLHARTQAMNFAPALGVTTPFRATSALFLRQMLRAEAIHIVHEHPSFGPMWEQIWSHELKQDPETTQPVGSGA